MMVYIIFKLSHRGAIDSIESVWSVRTMAEIEKTRLEITFDRPCLIIEREMNQKHAEKAIITLRLDTNE
jgi:hypothetical protein